MNGWWSHRSASVAFSAGSVMSRIVYSCWLPAVGAWNAAFRMAARSSGVTGSGVNTRTLLRAERAERIALFSIISSFKPSPGGEGGAAAPDEGQPSGGNP